MVVFVLIGAQLLYCNTQTTMNAFKRNYFLSHNIIDFSLLERQFFLLDHFTYCITLSSLLSVITTQVGDMDHISTSLSSCCFANRFHDSLRIML